MKAQTLSITVSSPRDEVFAFLSDIANIPHWAPRFCRSMRKLGTDWRVTLPAGEFHLACASDARTGVIDLFLGRELDEMMVLPLRVVSLPHGCAVIVTYFQAPDLANETYEQHCRILLSELRGLTRRFGGGDLQSEDELSPSFHSSIVTARFYESWDFYSELLGFRTLCECGHYVHLRHPSGAEFGLLREEAEGAPAELVSRTEGRGFWLSINVPDADKEHARLRALGVEIAATPQDQPWGERRFIVRDPNGILIWISHRIPALSEAPEAALAELG